MDIWNDYKTSKKKWQFLLRGGDNYAVEWLSRVYVNPSKKIPPDFVKDFVLAHEREHVRNKDSLKNLILLTLSLLAIITTFLCVKTGAYTITFHIYVFYWVVALSLLRRAERRADSAAIEKNGYDQCVQALTWMLENSDGSEKVARAERLENFKKCFSGYLENFSKKPN